jgi:predicted phage tail component-like protein
MKLTFNGVSSESHSLLVTNVKRGVLPPKSAQMLSVPGKPGTYFFRTDTDVAAFTVSLDLIGEPTLADFEARKRKIAEWLDVEEPAPLVFDYEPELTYYAIPDGSFDLERLGTYGSFDVTFIAPDPYAHGVEKSGTVARVYPIFSRDGGIRYRDDGSEVTADYPWYQSGKFDEAVLVEEGTENLLTSASSPIAEELSVTPGADYTLSLIGTNSSAKIEHKRTEPIANTSLEKEGEDYTGLIDTNWSSGTLSNVVAVSDGTYSSGILQLAKSGTDFSEKDSTFEGTYENTEFAGDRLVIKMPAWDYRDFMGNLSLWNGGSTAGASVMREGDTTFIRITSTTGATGIDKRPEVSFTNGFTLDMRVRSNSETTFYISDGNVGFIDTIPNTNNEWAWVRIAIANSTNGAIYQNGQLLKTISSRSYTTRRVMLGYSSGTAGKVIDIDAVYYVYANHGAPPDSNIYSGNYYSGEFDISNVGLAKAASYTPTIDEGLNWSGDPGTIDIKFQLGTFDGTSTTWSGTWSDTIPVQKGDDLSDKRLKYWVHMETRDSGESPQLFDLTMSITSGYHTSGYRESPVTNPSRVVKAAEARQEYFGDLPEGTSVKLETQYSLDGGTTWSEWAETENGGQIPGITQNTDLSNARFKYKFILSTTDVAVTPSLDRSVYTFTTGYKPSQTFTIPAYSVGSIGVVASSSVTWTETTPASTEIKVESSLDGETWTAVENGGELLPAGTDLSGKSLYLRYTLSTSDTRYTPMMGSALTWAIAQQESSRIIPATDTLVLTPSNVDRWQLEAKQYATGWHAYGTPRNAETLRYKSDILNSAEGTIELWAQEKDGSNMRYLFDLEDVFSAYQLDGKYVVVFGQQTLEADAPADGWHHVAIRWSRRDVALFLDGNLAAGTSLASDISIPSSSWLYIGCRSDGTTQWNALIDDLMFSNVARSNDEIMTHATSGAPMPSDEQTALKVSFDGTLAPDTTQGGIKNEGTAPTYPVITIAIADRMPYLRISNGADYVYIEREFSEGDIVEIDCERALATVNGARVPVSLDSNFFPLRKGAINLVLDPVGMADVSIRFVERWK